MENSSRYEGNLVRWNEEKGFGFIQSENRGKDVFIHISALMNMSRRPVVGDIIFYRLHVEKDGKLKAVDAKIQGVPSILPTGRVNTRKSQSSFPYVLIFLAVVGFAGYFFYEKANFQSIQKVSFADSTETIPSSSVQKYSCQGKVHCSEMTSCEEADFYLQNCPGTKMDGDGDGKPCEDRCGH
ncbi:MAG: excalibur calcium-binding domain-containing protein [Candidatus Electronema sp. VV]